MSFVNPILFGLGAAFVALPIVLHFLRRRRPPVRWGAMRFLLEAYRSQRRRLTLERLLLLASRCLLVLLVALLIGRPTVGGDGSESAPRDVYLLLDNSITSSLASGEGSELDRSKAAAQRVIERLDPGRGDRAALVLLGGPAEAAVFPPSSDLAAVSRVIDRAEPTDSRADLAGGLGLVGEAIEPDADVGGDDDDATATVVVASGFRAGSVPIDAPLARTGDGIGSVVLTDPAASAAGNTAVTRVRPQRRVVVAADRFSGQAAVTLAR
ncbi:MAG: BatA domain-containing protein, partial [Planctomycetota bacterium]